MIIGLQGPAGSGKSTMARAAAAKLGGVVMEGGIWYRALTYVALQDGVALDDVDSLKRLAAEIDLKIEAASDGSEQIIVNGADVTAAIYTGAVSEHVAEVGGLLDVRTVLEGRIIDWARGKGLVIMVGRNLQRAFPDAPILHLTIDDAEAERRHALRAKVVTHPVADRNALDRETAKKLGTQPQAGNILDVTNLSVDEQNQAFVAFIKRVSIK